MCTYIWRDKYACVMDKADDISKNKFSSKWSEQRLPQCNEVIFFLFWKVDLLLLHICLPCLIEFVCIKLNINTLRRNGYVIWTSQRVLDVMKYLLSKKFRIWLMISNAFKKHESFTNGSNQQKNNLLIHDAFSFGDFSSFSVREEFILSFHRKIASNCQW